MASTKVKISLAAAISLRFLPGRFWRDASTGCLNLLLDSNGGCLANCSYCGLARERVCVDGEDSFIRVNWPAYPLSEVLRRTKKYGRCFKRICLSMVVHPDARLDTFKIISQVKNESDLPLSLLASPSVLQKEDLHLLKEKGLDRFTVAVDTANENIFERYRGEKVRGSISWSRYWQFLNWASMVFNKGKLGAHWIVGLGESEKELIDSFLRIRRLEGKNHLFSFFPETGSALSTTSPPPLRSYRRLQLARFLIDENLVEDNMFAFDDKGKLIDFALSSDYLDKIIDTGRPFLTSGCPGSDGEVACNRPFGDSRPGPLLRNYPFQLNLSDVRRVRRQLGPYSITL